MAIATTMRQCVRGEPLLDAEELTHLQPSLNYTRRGEDGHRQLHRGLLQPQTAASDTGAIEHRRLSMTSHECLRKNQATSLRPWVLSVLLTGCMSVSIENQGWGSAKIHILLETSSAANRLRFPLKMASHMGRFNSSSLSSRTIACSPATGIHFLDQTFSCSK